MRLIVNTNRIIAALIKDSYSRKIIMSRKFELITIGFANSEVLKYKKEILKKAALSDKEFDTLLSIFFTKIYVVDDSVIRSKKGQAKKIMDKIDPDDSPFVALALAIENDGIWSDDKHFKEQAAIKIWNTKDLVKYVV